MKRLPTVLVTCLLLVSLTIPVAAFAGKGNGQGNGNANKAAKSSVSRGQHRAKPKAARDKGKAAVATGASVKHAKGKKAAASAESSPAIEPGRKGGRPAKPSDEASASDSTSRTVGPGIANAFARITANLEKSLAKIAAGKKTQLPPGLVSVWMKFAAWLGVDQSLMPGTTTDGSADTSESVEPTVSPEPTATVEPTGTVEPTSSIDASATTVL